MAKRTVPASSAGFDTQDPVFDRAADLFRIMSAPMRLRILNCLRDGEKNVSYLLTRIDTTQPNMSQHLGTLYQAGVLGKRREGAQIHYRIIDERVAAICQAVCSHVLDGDDSQDDVTACHTDSAPPPLE